MSIKIKRSFRGDTDFEVVLVIDSVVSVIPVASELAGKKLVLKLLTEQTDIRIAS